MPDDLPPEGDVQDAWEEDPEAAPEAEAFDLAPPPEIQDAWNEDPEVAPEAEELQGPDAEAPAMNAEDFDLSGMDAEPSDQPAIADEPKFFAPPTEEAPQTADIQADWDNLPEDAQKTLARLRAEAQPKDSPQRRQVQRRSAVKSAQRRQRLGTSATPMEQGAWSDLAGGNEQLDQPFNDDPVGNFDPGNQIGPAPGGQEQGGNEKLVEIGEKIVGLLEQVLAKLDAEVTNEDAAVWG